MTNVDEYFRSLKFTPTQKKLILFVRDNPQCNIWAIMMHMWPTSARSKAKLRRIKNEMPISSWKIFSVGSNGWELTTEGKRIAAVF